MAPTQPTRAVVRLDPVGLRHLIATTPSAELIVIDVRQPEEYRERHIPGACLIPLLELELRGGELMRLREPRKVFYSRTGSRSLRAAEFALTLGMTGVCELEGGLSAYGGDTLPYFAALRLLEPTDDLASFLRTALALERGTERLYASMLEQFRGTRAEPVFRRLAQTEAAHARALYHELARHAAAPIAPLERLMASLPGDAIEGGETSEEVAESARRLAIFGPSTVLELALEIELRALDLYRTLAHRSDSDALRTLLLGLADQEKEHAGAVLAAIAELTASSRFWV